MAEPPEDAGGAEAPAPIATPPAVGTTASRRYLFPGAGRGPGPTALFERCVCRELRAWAPAFAGERQSPDPMAGSPEDAGCAAAPAPIATPPAVGTTAPRRYLFPAQAGVQAPPIRVSAAPAASYGPGPQPSPGNGKAPIRWPGRPRMLVARRPRRRSRRRLRFGPRHPSATCSPGAGRGPGPPLRVSAAPAAGDGPGPRPRRGTAKLSPPLR